MKVADKKLTFAAPKSFVDFFCAYDFFRDPITERQRIIGVSNHLLSKVIRFHCHSKKVIGSLGFSQAFFGIFLHQKMNISLEV